MDLAGFPDEDGQLGRPVPEGKIFVPQEIWTKNECIHWRMGRPRAREVSRSMLNQFVRVKDADAALSFARQWGVLALSGNLWSGHDSAGEYYLPGRQSMEEGVEPVTAWQYYSKRAQAVLNVAASLKQGKLGDMGDWSEFAVFFSEPGQYEAAFEFAKSAIHRHVFGLGFGVFRLEGTNEERQKHAREVVAGEITNWLDCWKKDSTSRISDLALHWRADQQRWALQIDYHGLLFPAIALQLALVLAAADSLFSCSGCGMPYSRPRERKRPKSGYANYCEVCTDTGVSKRRAVETYRQKKAEAVRLFLGGNSVPKIAVQLNAEASRVNTWLEKGGKDAEAKARKQ